MNIIATQRAHMARLFGFLAVGERVARDCARRQSRLATRRDYRRFFSAQSRHEAAHALLFDGISRWLDAKATPIIPAISAMVDFGLRVEKATNRGDLDEAILGQQLILEGLGDVVLDRVNFGIGARGLGFERARHVILGQEHAHHAFGRRWADQVAAARPERGAKLALGAVSYLEMIDRMLRSLGSLFEIFDEDEAAYRSRLERSLPIWVRQSYVL